MNAPHLKLALALTALAVAACGDSTKRPTPAAHRSAAPAATGREDIVIKTRIHIPTSKVLAGSRIGDAAFCPGGRFRDREGHSADLGLVVKTFHCADGRLTITFSPTQASLDQSSDWRIVSGTGHFAGLRGHGQMEAHFRKPGVGRETFTGKLTR